MYSKAEIIVKGFLPSYEHDVLVVKDLLMNLNLCVYENGYEMIRVDNEKLFIPYRIHFDYSENISLDGLTDVQTDIYWCLVSRHSNGYHRQAALKKMCLSKTAIARVYTLILLGEYVREIVEDICHHIGNDNIKDYALILKNDPAFANKIKGRIASSWGKSIRSKYVKGERNYRKYKGRLLLVAINKRLNMI